MGKKATFFKKIFSGYLVIIILSILIISTVSYNVIRNHYVETLASNLKKISTALRPEIKPLVKKKKYRNIEEKVVEIAKKLNEVKRLKVRLTIIGDQGKVYGDSETDPTKMDNHKSRPEIAQALKGKVGQVTRYSRTMDKEMLYIAIPIKTEKKVIGAIRTSLYLKDINQLLNSLEWKLFYIFLGVTVVSIFISLILSKSFYTPFKKLKQAAKKLSKGNFDTRVYLNTEGEVKKLGDTFNDMAEQISNLFQEIKMEKESLDCILSSVFAGIVVLNEMGKVKSANDRFLEYFGKEYEDKYLWEILQEGKISDYFEKLKERKENFSRKIIWQDKSFLCSFSYAEAKDEYIIVFNDITEIKKVEKVKEDFVSNVSHELRTPLTTIKGFIETLKMEEEDEQKNKYLDIMQKHTDRLINIVKDLLTLSKLEKGEEALNKQQIDFEELVQNLNKIYQPKTHEKGLEYNVHVDSDIDYVGDEFKISQIITNLIDNAIKYTDEGEVSLSISKKNQNLRIEVEDTGIGIPEEDRKRIFERFYVADKSRSRKSGGTGLGLSIIKHIIMLHSGTISVESTPGEGTKFEIELPDLRD